MRAAWWPLLVGLSLACGRAEAPPAEHLLILTIDTLRADHLAVYGGPVETPSFDRLAREGALVEHAVTPVPSTGPAHASLLTGRHPWNHGVLANAVALDPVHPTLPERLRAAGLETAAFVSSYVLHERFGFARGFDTYELVATEERRWEGEAHERFFARGEVTVSRALAWLDARGRGGRFFLWIHLFDPHDPFAPPDAYLGPASETISLENLSVPLGVGGPSGWREQLRRYRGEIRYVDAQLARLLAGLEERRLLDRTALVVTADHGEGFGEHGHFGHGAFLHDEQLRVPLLVRAPDVPAGRRLRGPAQLEDLHPTALSLLGLPPGEEVDGIDLTPWLRGEVTTAPRSAAVGQRRAFRGLPDVYFHTTPDSKWIGELAKPGTTFDLLRDPNENEGAPASTPDALIARLAERPAHSLPDPETLDPEVREALEALGYLDEAGASRPDPRP